MGFGEGEGAFRQMLAVIPAAVYACRVDGTFAFFNEQAVKMWGQAPDQTDTRWSLCGAPLSYWSDGTVMLPEDSPIAGVLSGGTPAVDCELIIERADRSRIDVLLNCSAILDSAGIPCGAVAVLQDITERNRAAAALRESEERLRLAAEAANLYAWEVNFLKGEVTYSDNAAGIFGFETIPEHWCRLETAHLANHPEDRAVVQRDSAAALRGDREFSSIFRQETATGGYRWVESRGTVERDPSGKPLRMHGVSLTIDERKRTEETLRRAADFNAFRLALADALRPHAEPLDIQAEAARVLGEHLGVSRVVYGEIASDGSFTTGRNYVSGVPVLPAHSHLSLYDEGLIESFSQGRTQVVEDVRKQANLTREQLGRWHGIATRAHVSVPLVKGGRLVAALAAHHCKPREWTETEILMIEETAERTWAAVERVRAEEALRRSEERLRKAISIETVGVLFFRSSGAITDANEAFLRMSGSTHADLERGRLRWNELTPPEWRQQSRDAMEELRTLGRTTPYVKEYVRSDRSRWWALCSAAQLSGEENVAYIVDITEQKRTEGALRESEARLAAIFEQAAVGMSEVTLDGQFERVNEQLCWLVGRSEEDLLKAGVADVTHPEDVEKSFDAMNVLMKSGRSSVTFDKRYLCPDGRVVWASTSLTRLDDENGQARSILAVVVDLTARRMAEEALRANEEQFRLAISEAPIPVIMHAEDGEVLQVSKAWTELTGYARGEIRTFEAWLDQIGGVAAEELRAGVYRLFPGADNMGQVELEISTRSGERRSWVFSGSSVGKLPDGRRFVVLMALDVTERRQAEQALAASEERLRLVIENASEYAIFAMDCDRRVTSWNSGAERLLGYRESEIVGETADIIFTPEDRGEGAPESEAKAALEEGRGTDERWHLRKDHTRFWGNGVLMPMHDGENRTIGFVKILRDETDERQAREALEQSRTGLIAALQDAERARAEAETAGRAKDHFLAVLSHELRTPLTPVLLATRTLTRKPGLPRGLRDALEMISRNVQMEAQLIDDLLDLTRLAKGKVEIQREPVDIHEVAHRAAEICACEVEGKSQDLAISLEAEDHRVLGDATRLQQVLWNLLKNASKFTPEHGEVRLRSYNAPGRVLLEVSDSGVGIAEEEIANIFNPFEQANKDVAREFGGLGLGLAIARSSVLAHGGEVRAWSAGRGEGATFTVELPLLTTHEGAAPTTAHERAG